MPIRGAKVHRGPWFQAVLAELHRLGFVHCESPTGLMAAPGFYWYRKNGYLVRILPRNTLQITRPGKEATENRVPDINDVCRLLIDLDYEIQFGATTGGIV